MKVAIQDASILFDLECSGLLPLWFQLGIETHISVSIQHEIDPARHVHLHACIQSKQIRVHSLTAGEEFEARILALRIGGVTKADVTCYLLARKIQAMLLTGDKQLRSYSESQGIDVHGILWIFDQLIEAAILKPSFAVEKLEQLCEVNAFLPRGECKKRIAAWKRVLK